MVKILTAHQPQYIPWLGFFHKIACSDVFCLWDDVQFEHYSFMHRNKIKTKGGELVLSVPVKLTNFKNKKNSEIQIDVTQNWATKHRKAIEINYAKSPYFESYIDDIKQIYNKNWIFLTDLNDSFIRYVIKELSINVEYIKSSDHDFQGQKDERVLDMCNKLNADVFIFGEGGKKYVRPEVFKNANKNFLFRIYNHPVYPQLYGEFIPNLSILDLLFNCGEKSYNILLEKNITKKDIITHFI